MNLRSSLGSCDSGLEVPVERRDLNGNVPGYNDMLHITSKSGTIVWQNLGNREK